MLIGCCYLVGVGFSRNISTNSKGVPTAVSATSKSGKWVAEYGGGSVPFRCYCASHALRSQCRVGDYTSDVTLCE